MRVLSRLSWFISPLALLICWAVVAYVGLFPANLLIPPLEVWHSLTDLLATGELQEHLAGSLSRLALGFTGGALAGLGFGAALALSKTVEA
ncbi:ABC transporter permease, partial [Salmonella enterica subsp. enterica serovar Enteritidis]|nr:ABC transporter permease [Salmonella enterica subsp. enterica serovar Enteritidis]